MSSLSLLLSYEFLTFYGILQQSSIISILDYTIYIKNLNHIAENWIITFFTNRNISFKLDKNNSQISTKIYYFETIEKHFIFWLKSNSTEDEYISSTIHPYLFKISVEEFFHLLRGWIFGNSNKTIINTNIDEKNCFIVFLFINQTHNILDACNLLEKFQINYNFTSNLDCNCNCENKIEYLFIELDKEIYDHFY